MDGIEDRVRSTLRTQARAANADGVQAWHRFAVRVHEAPHSPTQDPKRLRRSMAVALTVVLGTVLSVGAVLVAILKQRPAGDPGTREPPLMAFLGYLREGGTLDYEPARTPAVLAARVDAVVIGTIEGVQQGQSYASPPDPQPAVTTSVLEVEVSERIAGTPRVVHGGRVYIEVLHPAFVGTGEPGEPEVPFDHSVFAQTVPIGAEGIFFLYDRTDESYSKAVINEGAGRPGGAPLTQAFIQGFLIETDGGELVSVLESFEAMPPAWRNLGSIEEVVAATR